MDDDDVFVLKSDSETEKEEKHNENVDQNKKFDQKICVDSIINNQKKNKKKDHHHHHHHHHHKSKSKSKAKSETKNEGPKIANLPIIQNETFCINNTPKEEDENYIVNFKFELSDSVELSDEKPQTSLPPLQLNSPPKENQNTPKQVQLIKSPPKTEIKASSIATADIIQTPIMKNNIYLDNITNICDISCASEKTHKIPQIVFVKNETKPIQTPKKIQLTTNRNKTNSEFEYRILNFLDHSLNHLSQDFLYDFQFYVQNAFSYEHIFDDFITSLNTEILDIFHDSKICDEKEVRLIDNLDKITEKLRKDMPQLHNKDKRLHYEEDETIEIADLLKIQENFFSVHQFFNEIQSCNSEKSNLPSDDEMKDQYNILKNAQLKRIELESISEIQIERLNRLEDQIKEIQGKNEINMAKKFTNCNSNKTLKDSLVQLIEDMKNMAHGENHYLKSIPNFDKFKKSLCNYISDRDQLSYEIELFGNFTEKSFCPLFSQMNNIKSFQLPFSHRRENIISQ